MNDQTITCPSCGQSIPLSETLTKQLHTQLQKEYESKLEKQRIDFEKNEKIALWNKAKIEAKKRIDIELKDSQNQLEEQKKEIEEFKVKELELRKAKRELEEEKKKIELEVTRRVDEERKKAVEIALKSQAEEYRLKMLESEKKNDMMKKTIEDLKRKSEQGSMQIQGEAQETDLKNNLQIHFPTDMISDVPTGVRGGDIVQTVINQYGQKAGVILWESKNTKNFSIEWITKLKDDQGRVNAHFCILVTRIMPDTVKHFGFIEGVWVTEYAYIVQLTQALRMQLIHITSMKQTLVGREKKSERLLDYISGSQFTHKIQNIISTFTSLKAELESEKRAMQRIWSKREKDIERVVENTSSFYGDLQGVTDDSLPKISSLELAEGST